MQTKRLELIRCGMQSVLLGYRHISRPGLKVNGLETACVLIGKRRGIDGI